MSKTLVHKQLFLQLMRFGVVGGLAAMVHLSVVVMIVQTMQIAPLVANVMGFLIGFQVSYYGHRYFTFADSDSLHRVAIPKLFLLQVMNFIINEYLFFVFLSWQLPYPIALFLVLAIMPLITFFISK